MPQIKIKVGGSKAAPKTLTVDDSATISSIKSAAGVDAALTLLVSGLPAEDTATLAASRYDNRVIVAVRRGLTMAEVASHKVTDDLWLALHAPTVFGSAECASTTPYVVYDVSEYMDSHPGGPSYLLDAAGAWGRGRLLPCA